MKRLLYQSFGPPSNEPYLQALRGVVDAVAMVYEVTVELGGLQRARLGQKQFPAFHLASGSDLLDALLQADRSGYDAAIIGNIQDPALYECRQLCEMPVVGMLEATMATAMSVGRSVVLVTTAETTVPLITDRLRLYGYAGRVHSIRSLAGGLAAVSESFADRQSRAAILREFIGTAEGAVREGAEVVIPASGMLATLISVEAGPNAAWDLSIGVPVLNPAWLAIAQASNAAHAYGHGLTTSRRLMFKRPPDPEVEAYLEQRSHESAP